MRLAKLPGALVIITGLLIMTGACVLAIVGIPDSTSDWFFLGGMILVGLGGVLGGSDLTAP
jgi:hypothetical protein